MRWRFKELTSWCENEQAHVFTVSQSYFPRMKSRSTHFHLPSVERSIFRIFPTQKAHDPLSNFSAGCVDSALISRLEQPDFGPIVTLLSLFCGSVNSLPARFATSENISNFQSEFTLMNQGSTTDPFDFAEDLWSCVSRSGRIYLIEDLFLDGLIISIIISIKSNVHKY